MLVNFDDSLPLCQDVHTLEIWIYLNKSPMDLEFWQESSKLQAQSKRIWSQACSPGISSVLVPDFTGSSVSEGSLKGEGIEGGGP